MDDEALIKMLQECGAPSAAHYTSLDSVFLEINDEINITKLADLLDDYFREKFDLNPVPSYSDAS